MIPANDYDPRCTCGAYWSVLPPAPCQAHTHSTGRSWTVWSTLPFFATYTSSGTGWAYPTPCEEPDQ